MDRDAWRAAIAAGWLATLAERDGAEGAGAFDLALALEQAGRQLMLIPLVEAGAVALTLAQVPAQAAALADLLAGRRLIVPATEPPGLRLGPGGDGVRFDDRAGELNGAIAFVPYARSADTLLVDAGTRAVSRAGKCRGRRGDDRQQCRRLDVEPDRVRPRAGAGRGRGRARRGGATARRRGCRNSWRSASPPS